MWYRVMLAALFCLPTWGEYFYTYTAWTCPVTFPRGSSSCYFPGPFPPGGPEYELIGLWIDWSSSGSTAVYYTSEYWNHELEAHYSTTAWVTIVYPGHTYSAEAYSVVVSGYGIGGSPAVASDGRAGSSGGSELPTSLGLDFTYDLWATAGTDVLSFDTTMDLSFTATYLYFKNDEIPYPPPDPPPPDPILTPEGGTLGQVGGALLGLSVWLGRRWKKSGNRPVG